MKLVVPQLAGTGPDVLARALGEELSNAEINKAIDSDAMKERLAQQMPTPMKGEPQEVEQLARRDAEFWGPIITKLGVAQ